MATSWEDFTYGLPMPHPSHRLAAQACVAFLSLISIRICTTTRVSQVTDGVYASQSGRSDSSEAACGSRIHV